MSQELINNKELQEHLRILREEPINDVVFGKFGRIIFKHLQETYPQRFMELKISGELVEKVQTAENEAIQMFIAIENKLLKDNPMPKTNDALERVRHLNKHREVAEEIVKNDLIFKVL